MLRARKRNGLKPSKRKGSRSGVTASAKELPGWIHKRMAGRGLKADRATINALARKIEGNLLAAVQEIDR